MTDAGGKPASYDAEALHRKYLDERDKRLRRDGQRQYIEATGAFEDFTRDPYVDAPLSRDAVVEDVDVAIVGGGFGGLLTAAKLRERGITSFRIVEQAGDFGGTWYWNRYPGVRCDIESYVYMPLLEEVGTIPREKYATGAEIFAHCQAIGRRYDLYARALFQTKAVTIVWDEASARWHIKTDRGDTLRARFVTVSQGPLAKVKLPGIPGIKSFKGKLFHSSRWDYRYTGGDAGGGQTKLATERVAVIGTGATAVQIVPRLAEHAGHLFVFQRTPSAVDVRDNAPTDPDWFKNLPRGWQQQRMNNFLAIISGLPQGEDIVGDRWTDFWKRFGALMAERDSTGTQVPPPELMQRVDYAKMEEIRARVSEIVKDPRIAAAIKPWYNYLCKRPLFSDEFLEAFNRDNVTLVDTDGRGVDAITGSGVVSNGREYAVECIIFATGFDVGAAPHKAGGYTLVGRNGLTLDAKWADGVRSVHGTQISGFPNFHIVGGTAQGTTAFNFTHTLSMQAEHATDLIARCLQGGVRTMEVTDDAERRWLAEMQAKHHDLTHFYEECTPGFLNNEGEFRDRPTFVGATYGAGPLEYERVIRAWRAGGIEADAVVTYDGEPFRALRASSASSASSASLKESVS
ncbi:MAG: NAD(P)/FAD-dependent oxidoreductase [Rhizomicrobium sp.]